MARINGLAEARNNAGVAEVDDYLRRQELLADHLTAMTGGAVEIKFSLFSHPEHDPAGMGHCFHGGIAIDGECDGLDFPFLDDRRGDLKEQLAAEFRRIAKLWEGFAAAVEQD